MVILRFLAAVLTASVTFAVLIAIQTIGPIWGHVSGWIIGSDIAVIPFWAAISAFMVVLPAIPLTAIALLLERSFGGRGYVYWSCAGAVIGIGCATLVALWVHADFPMIADDGREVAFAAQWWRVAPFSGVAGFLGGLVFEWIAARHGKSVERQFSA